MALPLREKVGQEGTLQAKQGLGLVEGFDDLGNGGGHGNRAEVMVSIVGRVLLQGEWGLNLSFAVRP